jgi:hypothetical protein
MSLFDDDWGQGNTEVDNTEITSTLLYFSTAELKEFKKLSKIGMKDKFPDPIKDGNVSDLVLILLREKYGNH